MSDDVKGLLVPVATTLLSLGAAGGVALLWRTVTSNRDGVRDLAASTVPVKDHLRLEARVERLEQDKVTTEGVRDVIEDALDKREAAAEKRRDERAKRYELQTRETVREEILKAINGNGKKTA